MEDSIPYDLEMRLQKIEKRLDALEEEVTPAPPDDEDTTDDDTTEVA